MCAEDMKYEAISEAGDVAASAETDNGFTVTQDNPKVTLTTPDGTPVYVNGIMFDLTKIPSAVTNIIITITKENRVSIMCILYTH